MVINKTAFKLPNGLKAYDIRVASKILNCPTIGRTNLLYYLRELNLLTKDNYSTPEYANLFLFGKIQVTTLWGFPTRKVVISDAGLAYLNDNGIYDKIRELSRLYFENKKMELK